MSLDSVPSCVQHGVSAADGTVLPYEKCAAFFTYASNETFRESDNSVWLGASNGTLFLVALGAIVTAIALIAWVKTEDTKLEHQAVRLREARGPLPGRPPAASPPTPAPEA